MPISAGPSSADTRFVQQRLNSSPGSVLPKLVEDGIFGPKTRALMFNLRLQLIEITNGLRLPVAGYRSELADAGALFSYGASVADQMRKAAQIVDKVLKGTPPASIPVEQPTRFEFVVNEGVAARLGIKIPTALLVRADRVIA